MNLKTDISQCDYMIDSRIPSQTATLHQPNYFNQTSEWTKLICFPFLDSLSSGSLGRAWWNPFWNKLGNRWKRVWGEYCILKRTNGKK